MAEILNYTKWLYLLPVAGILLTAVVSSSLNSKRVVIYPFSVKDFTEKTLVINYSVISKDMGVNRREVENVINHIIVDKIGVGRDETSPEKSLTDDLGVD